MKKILLFITVYAILFSMISLIRHKHYASQGFDLGIFDQTAWLYSKSLPPFNTLTNKLDYHDRYKPVMFLLGSIYMIRSGPEVLLTLQAFSLAFSGLFVFLIARKVGLKGSLAALLMIHYLFFPGITSFSIDDFHEVSLFPFFFLGAFYFYLCGNKKMLTVFCVLSLIIRDYLLIFSFVFWISFFFGSHSLKKFRNASLIKYVGVLHILMISLMFISLKFFGGINYGAFNSQGDDVQTSIVKLILNPVNTIMLFFSPFEKMQTIIYTMGYFLFFPLRVYWLWVPILFQFAGRFYDFEHTYRWTTGLHYSGELAAILALGTIFALWKIKRSTPILLVGLMVFFSLIITDRIGSPFMLLLKREFWSQKEWMLDNDSILKRIPKDASVATQNNLAPHLSDRKEIYMLPTIQNAQYIVLDLHPGQDQFNFSGLSEDRVKKLQIQITKKYDLIEKKGNTFLYKKSE